MAKLQKEVDRLEGNRLNEMNCCLFDDFVSSRRITCRKGEIQGRKRRTRHDIERIIGLLKQFQSKLSADGNISNDKRLFFFYNVLLSLSLFFVYYTHITFV